MAVTELATQPHTSQVSPNSVAMQFALDTFIETYRDMLTMQRLIGRHFGFPLAAFAFSRSSPTILKQLYQNVEALVAAPASALPSSNEVGRGLLCRLREDCRLLLNKGTVQAGLLEELAERAWLEGSQAVCAYRYGALIDPGETPTTIKRLPFLGHIAKMIKLIDRFAKNWPKLLKAFRRDENVLLFLMRRRFDLDSLYGAGFVRNLIAKLFPDGRDSLYEFITKAYKARGFQILIPTIDAIIEELMPW